jgi:hypothetical protein
MCTCAHYEQAYVRLIIFFTDHTVFYKNFGVFGFISSPFDYHANFEVVKNSGRWSNRLISTLEYELLSKSIQARNLLTDLQEKSSNGLTVNDTRGISVILILIRAILNCIMLHYITPLHLGKRLHTPLKSTALLKK